MTDPVLNDQNGISQERCSGCKFWQVFPEDVDAPYQRGNCRRFPPVIDPLAINEELQFFKEYEKEEPDDRVDSPIFWNQPSTWEDGWCGEFTKSVIDARQAQQPDLTELHKKGAKAWADVPDATAWVDELRGQA